MLDLRTIDISTEDASTSAQVVQAARDLGFIYVSDHGIPRHLIREVFKISASLFNLPREEKGKFIIGPENRGWSHLGSEKLDPATQKNADYKEAFNIAPSSNQALPELLETHRAQLIDFEQNCQRLCHKLCRLLAVGLGLEANHFSSKHNPLRDSGTILRLLYYPRVESTNMQKDEVRAGAHTDYGSMTCLFQQPGQSGLEVLDPASGTFEPVPAPTPSSEDEEIPILINIADQLTLWSSGELKSTMHRVTSTYNGDRYSIAYFCHPDDDTKLPNIPHDGTVSVQQESITAGEHLRARLNATYSYEKVS